MPTQNVFDLFARLLFVMRHLLEDVEKLEHPPRWVRIARARVATSPADVLGQGVKGGAKGFAEGMSFSAEIVLNLREILLQTDATEAFLELAWDFIKQAPSIVEGGSKLFGEQLHLDQLKNFQIPEQLNQIMNQVGGTIEGVMNLIPSPEDADNLGHELYLMLCVEQISGAVNKDITEHFNVATTGKARLMQWAFGWGSQIYCKVKPDQLSQPVEVSHLGSRRLWQAADANELPSRTVVSWEIGKTSKTKETLIDFTFEAAQDIKDINNVLDKLEYPDKPADAEKGKFGEELTKRLRYFQAFNDLPITGKLDNPTLNRLMNLDYASKNLLRAKPFDNNQADIKSLAENLHITGGMLALVNPMADYPEEEGLELIRKGGYAYYLAGHVAEGMTGEPVKLPKKCGWISDRAGGAIPAFIALQSRALIVNKNDKTKMWFDGELLSEGESASGDMFFAARIVEPWKAGRTGEPSKEDALFGPHSKEGLPKGSISRLYQWVSLQKLQEQKKANKLDLFVRASVLQRSLYTDRNKITKMPDQGRLIVELYDDTVFQGDLGTQRPFPLQDQKQKYLERVQTGWFPEQVNTVPAELSLDEVMRGRNWTRRVTEWLKVPEGTTAVLVALEGLHQSGWDIDAYFDNVELFYEFQEPPAKQ